MLFFFNSQFIFQTESLDHLEIYDGGDDTATKIGKFSVDYDYDKIISSGNQLFLKFTSDGSIQYQGFKAYFMRGKYPVTLWFFFILYYY